MDKSLEITQENFSITQFSIILSLHILAAIGLSTVTLSNISYWICAHVFFGTIGASIGLHRYFSHKSFSTSRVFENFLGIVGTLCFQGGPIFWASSHRIHHQKSEKYGDPHDAKRGFLWSHMLWLFYKNPNGYSYTSSIRNTADLRKNKFILFLEKNSTYINVLALSALCTACYAANNMALFFLLGPLRVVSVWHATWLINSYAHSATVFIPKETKKYRNSIFMCFVIGGDGNHEYHHKYPATPKHASGTFHLDYGYYTLAFLEKLNLVKLKKNFYQETDDSLRQAG